MQFNAIVTLFAITMAAAWTPGPNNALLAGSGAKFGLRRTIPHALGVGFGFPAMVFIVAVFLAAAFQKSLVLQNIVRYGGAVMLLWVAWKIASSGGLGKSSGPARPFKFHEAAAFQWVNPKAGVMAVALTSQFIDPAHIIKSSFFIAIISMASSFSSAFGWAALGTSLRKFLSVGHRMRVFDLSMGLIIALGVIIILRESL